MNVIHPMGGMVSIRSLFSLAVPALLFSGCATSSPSTGPDSGNPTRMAGASPEDCPSGSRVRAPERHGRGNIALERARWLSRAVHTCEGEMNASACDDELDTSAGVGSDLRKACRAKCASRIDDRMRAAFDAAKRSCVDEQIAHAARQSSILPDCHFRLPSAATPNLDGRRAECAKACRAEAQQVVVASSP